MLCHLVCFDVDCENVIIIIKGVQIELVNSSSNSHNHLAQESMPVKIYSTGHTSGYLRAIRSATFKNKMNNDMPKNWRPTSADSKVTFTKEKKTTNAYAHPRVFPKAVSFVSPFSKEGMERTK